MLPPGWSELLIVLLVVIILLSPWRIPRLARAIGEAKREFTRARSGGGEPAGSEFVELAKKLGIETTGKTVEQIAKEIEVKFKKESI